MTQFSLKDFSQIDRGSTIKSPVARVLECVRDSLSIPQIVKLTGLKRYRVRYALKRLNELNLVDLPRAYPVIPVLLVDFDDALKIVQERFEKKIGIPRDSGIKGNLGSSIAYARQSGVGEGGLNASKGDARADAVRSPGARCPPLLSAHRVKARFRLRGRLPKECDRRGKNGRKYWYLRDSEEGGACIEGGKRHIFVSVFGCRGSSVESVLELGLRVAGKTVRAWAARYGVRLESQGELVGGKHFVIEDKALSDRVKVLLNLEQQAFSVSSELGLARWYLDKSHKNKVEVAGAGAEEQVKSFVFLVNGGLERELRETRSALVSLGSNVGVLAGEFKGFVKRFEPGERELKGYG